MSCLFCRIAAGEEPAFVVFDTPDVVGFLDIRPVFKGHVLVIPRSHVDTLLDLPDTAAGGLFNQVKRVAAALEARAVITRPFAGEGIRVTVGTPEEDDVFLAALDAVRATPTA